MFGKSQFCVNTLVSLLVVAHVADAVPHRSAARSSNATCRYLPEDAGWPSTSTWAKLNTTVGGKLIKGVPYGQPCFGPSANGAACAKVKQTWEEIDPFLADPVNVLSSYFEDKTCNPMLVNASSSSATCTIGNLAYYAINVTDAASAIAGVNFARDNNVRLIIKNTGHDILGRSTGQGSLGLWTHNLKSSSFYKYQSTYYTGSAARIGAGMQVQEMYEAAATQGLRVTGGGCPTVGAAGGWVQSGGHGPLTAAYGLGADNTLEYEVVTASGQHLNCSRTQNSDLFWALSGGGPSNFAVVLSATLKAYPDGPVAGSSLLFLESNDTKYFAAVEAWEKHLLVLDTIPGFQTSVTLAKGVFSLDYSTLPDKTAADIDKALTPFYKTLKSLNITYTSNSTIHSNFVQHYLSYGSDVTYSRNVTVGNRLVPRSLVQNATALPKLTSVYKKILAQPNSVFFIIANNVTSARTGVKPGDNAVLPAWRDSLFLLNFGILNAATDPYSVLTDLLAVVNGWQSDVRALTPGGGNYANEATYNNPNWKTDYYGDSYAKLAQVKAKWDPNMVLWNTPAPGSDAWHLTADGHLCAGAQ